MPSLANRYPDLLTTLDDPAISRLITDLDAAYDPANAAVGPPPSCAGASARRCPGRRASGR